MCLHVLFKKATQEKTVFFWLQRGNRNSLFLNWIRIQTSAERRRHLVETKVLWVGRGWFEALIIDQPQSRPLFLNGWSQMHPDINTYSAPCFPPPPWYYTVTQTIDPPPSPLPPPTQVIPYNSPMPSLTIFILAIIHGETLLFSMKPPSNLSPSIHTLTPRLWFHHFQTACAAV